MKLKDLILFNLLLFCFFSLKSQRANNWHFGNTAGLDFNSPPPVALINGQTSSPDNTSTISDLSGNLLFYTNGLTVWNKNHVVMSNGNGLIGHTSGGQCALIVPIPCDPNKYVIFHVTEYSSPGQLHYTVVDMSLNSGLGDVVVGQKNISLGTGWTEKLCAYYNPSGNYYWVFSHKWFTNQFVAFKVDGSTIATQSVTSSIGSVHSCGSYGGVHDAMGQLTISPDGTKMVNALTCQDKYELFDLNINTGALSNFISIPGNGGNAWGTAFSPDSKKLYTDGLFSQSVFQYDLNIYNQVAIIASQSNLYTAPSGGYNFGYMELGPDNKVYIAKPGAANITVIHNPNNLAAACNFSLLGPSISPKTSSHGLSRIAYNIPNSSGAGPIVSTGSLSCTNPTTQLSVITNSLTTAILWSGPGVVGANNTASIVANTPGIYTVNITSPLCGGTATYNLLGTSGPLTLTPNPLSAQICSAGAPVTLSVTGASSYTWSPASSLLPSTGSVVIASPTITTTYTINGINGVCSGSAMVTVSVNATPTVVIVSGNPTICAGTSATLSASGATSYTWNPGNLTGSVVVVNPTLTTLYTVIGSNGSCTASATTSVIVIPSPTISSLGSPASVCPGGVSNLLAVGALSYTWQPGSLTGALVTVTPAISTIYTVSGTNAAGCVSSSTLLINVVPIPTITIDPPAPTVCAGSSTTLSATGAINYTWSPGGNTTSSIVITPTANTTYTVYGDNVTCSGSATVLVTVTPSPTVSTITSSTIICSGSSSTLSASGATTYTWNPGNLIGSTVTVSPTSTTVYTVTGASGFCTDTETLVVVVDIGPAMLVVSSPTTVCSASGNSSTLTASGATSYTWNPGGVISSSLVITPTVTSTYSVTGSNTLGCVSTTTISFSVTPTPTLNTISSSTAVCLGNTATLSATGAGSYTWNPGALTGATVTVSPTVTTIYTVSGTNGNCTTTSTVSIIVNANPTLTASSSPTVICNGSSSTLTANGATTYTWNPGALSGQTVNVTPSTTTNYTVIGTSAVGCTATAITNVSVNVTTTVNVTASPTAICIGGSTTLTASGATSYTWNPGNLNGSSIILTPTITTTYTIVGLAGSCYGTKTISLIVNPSPTISISPSSPTVCNGNFVTLTASGGTTYIWAPVSLSGSSIAVAPTVNTTFTVTGYNSFGCSNTRTVTVAVIASPTVTAVSNPTSICSGSGASATLTATGATTYTWNPGNLIGPTVTVTPGISTTYTVTGKNVSSCTSTQTVSVLIAPTPTISVSATPSIFCTGSSATLTGSGATSYTWLPSSQTAVTLAISPSSTTVYTVTGTLGTCKSSSTFTFVVLPKPIINVGALPSVICSGGSSQLLANGANSYTWSPVTAVGNTVLVTPTVTTIYTVTGTGFNGCTNTASVTVTVNPTPTLITVPSATAICVGNTVTLTSTGALNYLYNPGAQSGSVIVVSPTTTTTYTITGLNAFGCSTSNTLAININPNPSITVVSSPTLACIGTNLSLSATGASNYTWMPIGSTGSTVVTNATNSINTYTVVGETAGCVGSATLSVLVIDCNNSVFGMTKAAGKPVLVHNKFYNVDFTVTAVNASSLNLTNVTLNEDLAVAFPMPSNFTVISQPIITSQNSSLTVNPLFDGVSQISLTSPATSTLLANKRDTLVFTVRIDPKGYYGPFKNWVIGFANVLGVIVADSSNNGFGWDPDHDGDPTNNDTVTVIDLPVIDLFIPDGFSPDGDGKNDFFFIKGLNERPIKLTIFNRWGNKVYEKSEYDNSWNGLVNTSGLLLGNNKVPQATYYYVIEFLDGNKETITGFVVVQY